ncbi:MAG: hypothetical protein GF317_18540 [Candidatus Lokiarchaeota archaeon]|nr:hypothetical protein [Candidatus Lokiarchaeota archaeon]MBD3201515.1 hypothetical protein [Candidatus Lokiarchaeota archaeon]
MKNLELLYLYGFSLRLETKLEDLLSIVSEHLSNDKKIGVVLLHDAVISSSTSRLINESIKKLHSLPISVYIMIPDLEARGLIYDDKSSKGIPIDYEKLVELMDTVPRIISWM